MSFNLNIGQLKEYYDKITPSVSEPAVPRGPIRMPLDYSKYDIGFVPSLLQDLEQQQYRYRAETQSDWDKFGNMLLRGAVGFGVAAIEPFGFMLDFAHIFGKMDNTSENLNNSFNEALMQLEEKLRLEFPIYTSESQPRIFSKDWFLANGDQMIRSLGYFIPGMTMTKIASKGIGLIGRGSTQLSKYLNASATLESASPGIISRLGKEFTTGLVNRIGSPAVSALANNYSEHRISAVLAYKENREIYFNAIKKEHPTIPDEIAWQRANEQAAQDAEDIVEGGKWNVLLETVEYMNLFKVPGLTRSFTRPNILKSLARVGFTANSEAWQEVNTGFLESEARRNAQLEAGLIDDDGSSKTERYWNRLSTYESLTEGLLGAFGGAGMQVFSELSGIPAAKQYKEMLVANSEALGDLDVASKIKDAEFIDLLYKNATRGTMHEVEKSLDILSDMTDDEITEAGMSPQYMRNKIADYKTILNEFETEFGFVSNKYGKDTGKAVSMLHLRTNAIVNKSRADRALRKEEEQLSKFSEEDKANPLFEAYKSDVAADAAAGVIEFNQRLLEEIPGRGKRSPVTNETAKEIELRTELMYEKMEEDRAVAKTIKSDYTEKEVENAYNRFKANKESKELGIAIADKMLARSIGENALNLYNQFLGNEEALEDYTTKHAEDAIREEFEKAFQAELEEATLDNIQELKKKYPANKFQHRINEKEKILKNEAERQNNTEKTTKKKQAKKAKRTSKKAPSTQAGTEPEEEIEDTTPPPKEASTTPKTTRAQFTPVGNTPDERYDSYINDLDDLQELSNQGEVINSDEIARIQELASKDTVLEPADRGNIIEAASRIWENIVNSNITRATQDTDVSTANFGTTEISNILEQMNKSFYGLFDPNGEPLPVTNKEILEETLETYENYLQTPFADHVRIKNLLAKQIESLKGIIEGVKERIEMQESEDITPTEEDTSSNIAAEKDTHQAKNGEPNEEIDEDSGNGGDAIFSILVNGPAEEDSGKALTSNGYQTIFNFGKTIETASTIAYLSREYTTRITLRNGRIVDVARFTSKNAKAHNLVKLVESHTKVQPGDKIRLSIDTGFQATDADGNVVLTYDDFLTPDGKIDPDEVPIMVEALIDGEWTFIHHIHRTGWITEEVDGEYVNTAPLTRKNNDNIAKQTERIKWIRNLVLDQYNKSQAQDGVLPYTYGTITEKTIGNLSKFVQEQIFDNFARLKRVAGRPPKVSKRLEEAIPENLPFGIFYGSKVMTGMETNDERVDWFFEDRAPTAPSLDGMLTVVLPTPVEGVYLPFPIEAIKLGKREASGILNTLVGVVEAYFSSNPNSLDIINNELGSVNPELVLDKTNIATLRNFLSKYIYIRKGLIFDTSERVGKKHTYSMFTIQRKALRFAINNSDTKATEIYDEATFEENKDKLIEVLKNARLSTRLDTINTTRPFFDLRLDKNGNINRKSTKTYDTYNDFLRHVLYTKLNGTNYIAETEEYTYFDQPQIFFDTDEKQVIVETEEGEEKVVTKKDIPDEEEEGKEGLSFGDSPIKLESPFISRIPYEPTEGDENQEFEQRISGVKSITVDVARVPVSLDVDLIMQFTRDKLKVKVQFNDNSFAIVDPDNRTVKFYGARNKVAGILREAVEAEAFIRSLELGSKDRTKKRSADTSEKEYSNTRQTISLTFYGDRESHEFTVTPVKLTGAKQGYRFELIDGSSVTVDTRNRKVFHQGGHRSMARIIQNYGDKNQLLKIADNWGKEGKPLEAIRQTSLFEEENPQYPNKPLFNKLPGRSPTPTMTYAGIGSRETPNSILAEMSSLADELGKLGYTLRTGDAPGADASFEWAASGPVEEYKPSDATEETIKIAGEIHPAWDRVSPDARRLHARNTFQVFGATLDKPVDFVIAWTPDGLTDYKKRTIKSGGTGQAIDMASRKGIPVINMANPNWRQQLDAVLKELHGKQPLTSKPTPTPVREYTPDNITSLGENEIFVFGSNRGDSRGGPPTHGRGAALTARQRFGAIQGQPEGLQGQSYAIVTKKFWDVKRSFSIPEISAQIKKFLMFAIENNDKKFYVTKLGSVNAGYTIEEIKGIFRELKDYIPDNVVLPREYEVREESHVVPKEPVVDDRPSIKQVLEKYIIPGIGNYQRHVETLRTMVWLVAKQVDADVVNQENALIAGTQYTPMGVGEIFSNVKKELELIQRHFTSMAEDLEAQNNDITRFNQNARRIMEEEGILKNRAGKTYSEEARDRVNALSAILSNWNTVMGLTLVKLNELGLRATGVSRAFSDSSTIDVRNITTHTDNTSKYNITETEEDLLFEDDFDAETSYYEVLKIDKKAKLYNDPKDTVSFKFKMFLSRIVDHKNENGTLVARRSYLGTGMYIDGSELFNSLSLDLADALPNLTYDSMIQVLRDKVENNPYYEFLIRRLESKDGERYRSEFVNTFAKHYKDLITIQMKDSPSKRVFKGNPISNSVASAFLEAKINFVEHQKQMPIAASPSGDHRIHDEVYADIKARYQQFIRDANELYWKKRKLRMENPKDVYYSHDFLERVRGFLSEIGIDVDMATMIYMAYHSKDLFGRNWEMAVQYKENNVFAYNLFNYTEKIDANPEVMGQEEYLEDINIGDYAATFTRGNPLFANNSWNIVNRIAQIQAEFGDRHLSHTLSDSKGYINYAIQDYEATSNTVRKLKQDKSTYLSDLVGHIHNGVHTGGTNFGKHSLWGIELIKNPLARKILKVETLDAAKSAGAILERERASAATQDLMAMLLFGNRGITSEGRRVAKFIGITAGDNPTTPVYTFFAHEPDIRINDKREVIIGDKTMDALMEGVLSEADRIVYWQRNGRPTGTAYDKGALKFVMHGFLNKEMLEGRLSSSELSAIYTKDKFNPTEEGFKVIRRLLAEHINSKIEELYDSLVEADIIQVDEKGRVSRILLDVGYMAKVYKKYGTMNKAAKYVVADFIINNTIANTQQYQLIYGDPAIFYQEDKEGNFDYQATLDSAQKRARALVSPFIAGNFDEPTYYRVTLSDDERVIEYAEKYAKVSGDDAYLEAYKLGDGFEVTTAEEDIKFRLAYDLIDYNIGKNILKKIRAAKRNKNNPTNFFTLDKSEEQAILNPIKPISFTHKYFKEYDLVYPTFTKSSAIGLYPFLTEGLEIDKLRVAMENAGVDRASHKSADKTISPQIAPVYNADGSYNTEALANLKNYRVELNRDGFGQQVKTPVRKTTVITSSQLNSMLFVDVSIETRFELYGKNYSRDEFIRLKEDTRKKMFDIGRDRVFKDMGITVDEATGELVFNDLEKIRSVLIKQADKLPIYSILEIEQLSLTPDKKQFEIPMFFSSASEKIESLILSVIKDRIVNQELLGEGFVQTPASGFTQSMEQTDFLKIAETTEEGSIARDIAFERFNNRIMYVEGFDPTQRLEFLLDKDGKLAYAQVLVAPYFRTIDGRKIDIRAKRFRKMTEDGRWVVDKDKLPPEILKAISIRIPYLSHSNGMAIEIVGFLPDQFKGMVVVPDGITIQSGGDFDLDKLYTYLTNYVYDELNEKFIRRDETSEYYTRRDEIINNAEIERDRLIEERKANRDHPDIAALNKALDEANQEMLSNIRKAANEAEIGKARATGEAVKKALREQIAKKEEEIGKTAAEIQSKIDEQINTIRIASQFQEDKIIKQKYLDIALSVFTNPDLKGLISKPLVNKDLDEVLEDVEKPAVDYPIFWSYQRDSYISQYTGKSLVAIIARTARIHALIQHRSNISLINRKGKEFPVPLGGFRVVHLSGFGKSNEKGIIRTKHANLVTFGNAAVDNASNPVLGPLNVNNDTIQAAIAGILLEDNAGNSVSAAYMAEFVLQPIVKDYVRELDKLRREQAISRTYTSPGRLASKAISKVIEKYNDMIPSEEEQDDLVGITGFTRDELVDMRKNGEEVEKFAQKQLSILDTFQRLTSIGEKLQIIGDVTLINPSGLGSSFSDVISNMYSLEKMLGAATMVDAFGSPGSSIGIRNLDSLVGTVDPSLEGRFRGFVPTTEEGVLYNNTVELIKEAFMPLSSSGSPDIVEVTDMIGEISQRELSAKDIKRIQDSVKRFVYSGIAEVLGVDSVREERQRLMYGTKEQKALGLRVLEYKNKVKKGEVEDYYFMSLIGVTSPIEKGDPYQIRFRGIRARGLSSIDLTISLAHMLYSNNQEVREIAEDLFNYAIINGAFRHAHQFIQYFPAGWMRYRGIGNSLRAIDFGDGSKMTANDISLGRKPIVFHDMKASFIRQYFQHMPYMAWKITPEEIDRIHTSYDKMPLTFYINHTITIKSDSIPRDKNELPPRFLHMQHPDGTHLLYERVAQVNNVAGRGMSDVVSFYYQRIDTLGGANYIYRGTSEFDATVGTPRSLFRANRAPKLASKEEPKEAPRPEQPPSRRGAKEQPSPPMNTVGGRPSRMSEVYIPKSAAVADSLERITSSTYKLNAAIASYLKSVVTRLDNPFIIVADDTLGSYGAVETISHGDKRVVGISINPIAIDRDFANTLQDSYERVILHEAAHGVTRTAIDNFLYKGGRGNTIEQNVIIRKIDALRLEAIEKLKGKVDIEGILKSIDKKLASRDPNERSVTPTERLYAGLRNLNEFVADAMSMGDFVKVLNELPSDLDYSEFKQAEGVGTDIFSRFVALVSRLLDSIGKALGITIQEGSIAEGALSHIINLIEVTETIPNESKPLETPFVDVAAEAEGSLVNLLSALHNRRKFLQKGLTGATNEEERKWRVAQIRELDLDIERNAAMKFSVETLTSTAKKHLEYIESVARRKNASPSELMFVSELVDTWRYDNARNFILPGEAMDPSNKFAQAIAEVGSEAERLRVKVTDAMVNKLLEEANKGYSPDGDRTIIKKEDILTLLEPNIIKIQTMHLGRLGNKLGDFVYKTLYDADKNQLGVRDAIHKEITKMFDDVLNDEKAAKKIGKDWDLFHQKDEDGNITGGLVNEYADKYSRAKESSRVEFEEAKEKYDLGGSREDYIKAKSKYYDAWRARHVAIDIRFYYTPNFSMRLDGELIKDPAVYKKHVAKYMGEDLAEQMIADAQAKYELYLKDRDEKIQEIEDDDSITDKDARIREWTAENDPIGTLNMLYPVGKRVITSTKHSHKYLSEKPRKYGYKEGERVETGLYDSNYQTIMEDETLKTFYGKYTALMNKLKELLPQYIQGRMPSNFLANIQKDLAETYMREGFMSALHMAGDSFRDSFLGDDISLINEQIDSETRTAEVRASGTLAKSVPIRYIQPGVPGKFKLDGDTYFRDVTGKTYRNNIEIDKKVFRKAAQKYMAERKSRDLEKLIRMFTDMAVNFQYKIEVEDTILLARRVLDEAKQIHKRGNRVLLDKAANLLKEKGGLLNFKQAVDYAMDALLYGKKRAEYTRQFGVVFDTYNPIERSRRKKRMRQIERDWAKVETDYDEVMGNVDSSEEAKEFAERYRLEKLVELESEYEKLGGRKLVWGKLGDKLLQYTQLKGLALNLTAGAANWGFGTVSNFVHANGRRDFTTKQLVKAMGIMLNTAKDISRRSKATSLIMLYDILFEVLDTRYGKQPESEHKERTGKVFKKIKNANPYFLMTKGEFFVQGAAFVAKMLHTKVTTKDGSRITLYEAYDEEGRWKSELFDEKTNKDWSHIVGPGETNSFTKFRDTIIAVNQRNHGNYDLSAPIPLKKVWIGRAIMQFRSWIPEGFASRFEEFHYDPMLDRNVVGRWSVYGELGALGSLQMLTRQLNPWIAYEDVFVKADGSTLDEARIEAMRKNLAELAIFAGMLSTYLLLRAAMDGDDDDESFRAKAINIFLAVLWRTSADTTFYVSPNTFRNIIKNPVPVMRTVSDFMNAAYGTWRYITDDEYQGDHPLKKWGQSVPITNEPIRLNYLATETNRRGLF